MSTPSRRQYRGTLHAEAGLGLIEALVTLLVMSVGALAALALQQALQLQALSAREQAQALHLALSRLDWLEHHPIGSTADSPAQASAWPAAPEAANSQEGLPAYELSHTVHPDPDLPAEFRRVSVRVVWQDAQGVSQQLQMHRLLQASDPSLLLLAAYPPEPVPETPFDKP